MNAGGGYFYNLKHNGAGGLTAVTSDLVITNDAVNANGNIVVALLNLVSNNNITIESGSVTVSGASAVTTVNNLTINSGVFTKLLRTWFLFCFWEWYAKSAV